MPAGRRQPGLRPRLLTVVLAVVVAGAVVGVVPASPAMAEPEPGAPQLSITVDNDGRGEVDDGDVLAFEITVENLGTEKVDGLQVSQTLPAGLAFTSAEADGEAGRGAVRWTVDLAAGDKTTLRSKTKVTSPPDDTLRLATVACASESPKAPPIVCASHLDALPAAAAAEAEAERAAKGDLADSSSNGFRWQATAGAGTVLLAALALFLVRRRRRRRLHTA